MVTIGIDEAGRGCWAGPLVAAAVYFPAGAELKRLNDSKKLSAGERSRLFDLIVTKGRVGIGWASPKTIDDQGLTAGQRLAMAWALAGLGRLPDQRQIIIDGPVNYLSSTPGVRCLVRADSRIGAVMAASIVAKVARDRFCLLLDELYPGWGLAGHKGYGTARHRQTLAQKPPVLGLHRFSYRPVAAYQTLARPAGGI